MPTICLGSTIEEDSDEPEDFIPDFPLYTLLTGVAEFERRRAAQQRGPLTERVEFSALYQSLTSLYVFLPIFFTLIFHFRIL
jgi:hypothetical protein